MLIAEQVKHVNRIKGLLFSRASPVTSRCGVIDANGWTN